MRIYLIVLIVPFLIDVCLAQGNIESPGGCSINSTGGAIINSQIYCYPNPLPYEILRQKKRSAVLSTPSENEDRDSIDLMKWPRLGFNSTTAVSLPIYMYPGMPHERDGQIAAGLKKALSSKLHFSDKQHAALFFEITDTNVYFEASPDGAEKAKGHAIFHVDLRWIDGTSLQSVDVNVPTEDIGGSASRDEDLQINAMNLGIKQACRMILSMVGDDCP